MRPRLLLCFLFISSYSFAQQWSALNDEGMQYYSSGNYRKAEEIFKHAVTASLKSSGSNSADYITTLTNLAYAQQMQADYPHAQQHFREALVACKHVYPSLHIENVEAIINLANTFLPAAQYDSCEHYLIMARDSIFKAARARDEHYNMTLSRFFEALINVQNSLASLFFKKGQLPEAIALMEQQHKLIKDTYPDDYRSLTMYESTLNNLSSYYFETGDIQKAIPVVQEQVSISCDSNGTRLGCLQALNNLGSMYRFHAQPDSAGYTWTKALHMIDEGGYYGSDLHVSMLNNLGELLYDEEDYDRAEKLLTHSVDIQENRPALNPRIYQTTLLNLAETYRWSGDIRNADKTYKKLTDTLMYEVLHNFTYLSDKEKIAFFRSNLSVLEFYTVFAFEAGGVMRLLLYKEDYVNKDALKDVFNLLLTTKGLILHPGYRLRKNIVSGRNTLTRTRYEHWEDLKYAYANLARGEEQDKQKLGMLAQEIEDTEKWLRSNSEDFRKGFVIQEKTWQDIQKALQPGEAAVEMVRLVDGLVYGALILTPSTTDGPVAVLVKSTTDMYLEKQFYKQYAGSIRLGLRDTASYNRYWKPVWDAINKNNNGVPVSRVYFSPDGIYNRINPNTLYSSSGQYVLDETEVRHVTNLKDMASAQSAIKKKTADAVLIGRPTYVVNGNTNDVTYADLAGTEAEVDAINRILKKKGWKTTVLKHKDAQEAAVKKLNAPVVLHIATHGFSPDSESESLTDNLLNSGIVLAGAGDGSLLEGEDGILTAYEVMNINLDPTRLVVLSACETGLGEFHTGEGIYGLQRALRSAGARAVIMSLWKVDDRATQQLMTTFYNYWLTSPEDMRGAFRKAQQQLRATFPNPYYWGAFVLTGE